MKLTGTDCYLLFRCRAVFRGNVKTPSTDSLLVNGKNAF